MMCLENEKIRCVGLFYEFGNTATKFLYKKLSITSTRKKISPRKLEITAGNIIFCLLSTATFNK